MWLALGFFVLSRTASAGHAALEPCRLPKLDEPALCGSLEVFEDRAARKGRKIALRVGVLPSTGPRKAPDPLFVLQGGPGQAATNLAEFYGTTFKTLRRERDIVLVDQRGTGGSNPLECALLGDGTDVQRLLGPGFPVTEVKACRERLAANAKLTLYSTPLAMDDLDDVRAWLGYDRINLYGTSYGTWAAQEYLRRHPHRVRSAVLKAVVASTRDWGVFWGPELSEGMFFTVMCAELTSRLDAKALARESAGTLLGEEPMRELMAACMEWPRAARPKDFGRAPKAETPVLLISGGLDPSTPPENGEALARDLRRPRHLVVPNGGHSFNNLGGCVDEIIAAFVAKGSADGLDTTCAERIALPPFVLPRP